MKDKFSRISTVIKKYGFLVSLKKLSLYARANLIDRINIFSFIYSRRIYNVISSAMSGGYDRIIIRASSFGYDVPLFQRPQHLAGSMADKGCLVFYEVTSMTDKVRFIKKIKDRLYLVNLNSPAVYRILMRSVLRDDKPKYVEVYSTDRRLGEKDLDYYKGLGFGIIYQYIDHISPEISGSATLPQNIMEKYRYAMRYSDVFIIATAGRLFCDVINHRGMKRVILSTNGVDARFFSHFEDFSFDSDFTKILSRGKPTVCYYGALASWIDYELISKIAESGKYSVVLIGIKYDASFDDMKPNENIHFLGHRDYKVLKYYAAACHILIIPFKLNEITKATSPLKAFEYMAIGRPIVCTDINECRKYESVLIAKSHDEFMRKLDRALELKNDASYKDLLSRDALDNTWEKKADEIISLLKEGE